MRVSGDSNGDLRVSHRLPARVRSCPWRCRWASNPERTTRGRLRVRWLDRLDSLRSRRPFLSPGILTRWSVARTESVPRSRSIDDHLRASASIEACLTGGSASTTACSQPLHAFQSGGDGHRTKGPGSSRWAVRIKPIRAARAIPPRMFGSNTGSNQLRPGPYMVSLSVYARF